MAENERQTLRLKNNENLLLSVKYLLAICSLGKLMVKPNELPQDSKPLISCLHYARPPPVVME